MKNLTKLILTLVALNLSLTTQAETLTVNSNPGFLDERIIPTNIVQECIEWNHNWPALRNNTWKRKARR